jgi:sporulation protein YlmC with PRC-barrel domain
MIKSETKKLSWSQKNVMQKVRGENLGRIKNIKIHGKIQRKKWKILRKKEVNIFNPKMK